MDGLMANFQDLWALVSEVWETSAFGIDVGRLLSALGIVLLFLLLRGVFTKTIIAYAHHLTAKSETTVDDQMLDAMKAPISFIPVIVGMFIGFELLNFQEPYQTVATNIIRSLIAFMLFWALYRAVTPLSFLFGRLQRIFSTTMVDWVMNAVRGLFVFLGIAAILEVWGIKVWPLLTGLGLFGVAVALGAQDMFKNLISGLLIIAERRFNPGDWILVDGIVEGTVEKINFRSTTIRRFDKAPVQVPNSKLSDNAVTNFSHMTHRRIYWIIGVEYKTSVDQLRQIRDNIENYVLSNEDFAKPPEVSTFVRINAFSDSSIDIMLYCFTRTTDWGRWLEIKEKLAYNIMEIVAQAGTGFAFPSQSVYLESVPGGDQAEIFQPLEDVQKSA